MIVIFVVRVAAAAVAMEEVETIPVKPVAKFVVRLV